MYLKAVQHSLNSTTEHKVNTDKFLLGYRLALDIL